LHLARQRTQRRQRYCGFFHGVPVKAKHARRSGLQTESI
jgi:hypothetical protein